VPQVVESGHLLRNGGADLTYRVLARTGIPLFCVYKDHIDFWKRLSAFDARIVDYRLMLKI
jgi:hypothetical protein